MSRAPHPYADRAYAAASTHMGEPFAVPEWGGHVLVRRFGQHRDAVGPYPLATLALDADLRGGLRRLADAGLVSVVLVADPLSGPSPAALATAFDLCRPFKIHQLVRADGAAYAPSKHHRDRIRRGCRRCRVERVALTDRLDDWTALYAQLVERREVSGPADFPADYWRMLADMPGLCTLTASVNGELAAMTLWFEHGGVAYNHLTASNALGRANGASFALYDAAIACFAPAVVNLGGSAGAVDDPDDGLAAFKRGFADGAVQAHLCGAVLDPARYAELSAGKGPNKGPNGYFPAYRG